MFLPDDIVERARAQPFGERRILGGKGGGVGRKEVGHCVDIGAATSSAQRAKSPL
jgi:hypothetical protein